MNTKPKAIFCWSGGKDSSYCLHQLQTENQIEVSYLLTTVNDVFQRVSMHGVREELIDQQAASIGIPLRKLRVSLGTNTEYETLMLAALLQAKEDGIDYVIYGDIFLEDLRAYREAQLAKAGLKGLFPLWKKDTTQLLNDFVAQQFKTVLCCVNDGFLGEVWAGKEIDAAFLQQLPTSVDPCGENGEYHTFCYDGPIFKTPISFHLGDKVYKPLELKTDQLQTSTKGFWFIDLVPRTA